VMVAVHVPTGCSILHARTALLAALSEETRDPTWSDPDAVELYPRNVAVSEQVVSEEWPLLQEQTHWLAVKLPQEVVDLVYELRKHMYEYGNVERDYMYESLWGAAPDWVKYHRRVLLGAPDTNRLDPSAYRGRTRNGIAFFLQDKDSMFLENAPDAIKNDPEVMWSALLVNPKFLRYASAELRANRHFMLKAVQKSGLALQYASPELQADREIASTAVLRVTPSRRDEVWPFVAEALRNDPEFLPLERERAQQERAQLERERLERDRLARERAQLERERLERDRLLFRLRERARQERERLARERAQQDERDRLALER
jgi:hypothetical protein